MIVIDTSSPEVRWGPFVQWATAHGVDLARTKRITVRPYVMRMDVIEKHDDELTWRSIELTTLPPQRGEQT